MNYANKSEGDGHGRPGGVKVDERGTEEPKPFLTGTEVCKRYTISPETLKKWRLRRAIPFVKLGHRTVRYPRAQLEVWERENAVQHFMRS